MQLLVLPSKSAVMSFLTSHRRSAEGVPCAFITHNSEIMSHTIVATTGLLGKETEKQSRETLQSKAKPAASDARKYIQLCQWPVAVGT